MKRTSQFYIECRIGALLQRDDRTTGDLVRLLAAVGVDISRPQAWRIATKPQKRISFPMLAGLCEVFACTPNDIVKLCRRQRGLGRSERPLPPEVRFDR